MYKEACRSQRARGGSSMLECELLVLLQLGIPGCVTVPVTSAVSRKRFFWGPIGFAIRCFLLQRMIDGISQKSLVPEIHVISAPALPAPKILCQAT